MTSKIYLCLFFLNSFFLSLSAIKIKYIDNQSHRSIFVSVENDEFICLEAIKIPANSVFVKDMSLHNPDKNKLCLFFPQGEGDCFNEIKIGLLFDDSIKWGEENISGDVKLIIRPDFSFYIRPLF